MAATKKSDYVRSIAVELQEGEKENKSLPGYCLTQLRDNVYNLTEKKLEIANAGNQKDLIEKWFQNLRRDILVEKLRATVMAENKAGNISMVTQTNIDGKTSAKISWMPGRLYPKMKIDSTSLSSQDFRFINDTANYGNTRDTAQTLELGQIKHSNYGFHYINDSIDIGVSLPTDFDDELAMLGITKPLTSTKYPINKYLFTFFLPLWLTATIVALILIYIFLVIRTWNKIRKQKLNGTIFIKDPYGDEILTKKVRDIENTSIGKGGNIRIADAEWLVQIEKVKPTALLFWNNAYFAWKCTSGYVYNGSRETSGRLDYKNNTSFNARCKAQRSDEDVTHTIVVKLQTL